MRCDNIKQGPAFRKLHRPNNYECVVMEICRSKGNIELANLYNPCLPLTLEMFCEIAGDNSKIEIWCGDCNAHNSLWGSSHIDKMDK